MQQHDIDVFRNQSVQPRQHLIDGKAQAASDGQTMEVISPINGQVLTSVSRGTAADIERAVAAARKAFEAGSWSQMAPANRKKILFKWADLIEAKAMELAVLGVRDNGTEISMAYKAEPFSAAGTIRYYAEALDKVYGEIANTDPAFLGLIHREPVGVVGAIIPWNFPMMIGAWKLGPALAAGNSVVLKPAETASLTLHRMAELALDAGLPAGVLNVVFGEGPVVGEALGMSMDVDVLVFTGSGGVGRRLLEYSARSNLKRVFLELGGKSPHIIFNDAPDLDAAAKAAAAGIFRNAGQVCVAGSRLLVQADSHDDFVAQVAKHAAAFRVGDPLDITTQMGAVNSARQLEQNLTFVARAAEQGAKLMTGGNRIMQETGGYFMEPTVFSNVAADADLAQKEVFGPVLAITKFSDEAEAIALANSTKLGLASGVWTSDFGRAHRMVRAIRAGVVHVNTYGGADGTVPLGGVGQSGNGHDKSMHAFDKYTDLKTAWMKL